MVAVVSGFYAPVLPFIGITVFLVILDFVSAIRLGMRMRRRGMSADPRLSSRKLSRLLGTVIRIFIAFTVASLLERLSLGQYIGSLNPVHALAGLICFRQIMSILENESCATDSQWAATARKYLADKTGRHLADRSAGGEKKP